MRRPWALPLVPLYAAGQAIQNAMRSPANGLIRPVVSVGSLSAGGAGKTPVVLMLARLLREHGVWCDVLSRGYGRETRAVEKVDPDGGAPQYGDEPLEMARAGLDVWVGANRFKAGLQAEAAGDADVHLLDDGFQHRRLLRKVNVVLLTLEDANDWLLPAGNLREPLTALRRADVLVIREEERTALASHVGDKEVWLIRRTMRLPAHLPLRPLAFCGIARPEGFHAGLRSSGCDVAGTLAFPDHHLYTEQDIQRLLGAAAGCEADGFLTTAKDAARLSGRQRAQLGRVEVVELVAEPLDPQSVWDQLQQVLGPGDQTRL